MNRTLVNCPDWLAHLIQEAGGSISFSKFMDLALNDPNHGAYSSGKLSIGVKGDFVTSPSLGPDFGQLLAVQITDWLKQIDLVNKNRSKLSIIDVGPGEGDLAFYLINALKETFFNLNSNVEYVLVEINNGMKNRQIKRLESIDSIPIRWTTLEELSKEPVTGIMLAHELLDALPVERLITLNNQLHLQGVRVIQEKNDYFLDFILLPIENSTKIFLEEIKKEYMISIPPENAPDYWTTEIHLKLDSWFNIASKALKEGQLLIIDYAIEASRYYSLFRSNGTLISYYKQKANTNILAQAGNRDITAHLCLETLYIAAKKNLFHFQGETRQGLALLTLGLAEKLFNLTKLQTKDLNIALNKRESLLRLVDPSCLGEFRWIVFTKSSQYITNKNITNKFLKEPIN
ncbi:class I SAM-dependent methyltransferase [Prochlorococcus marinus]|uniref:class I SAM-dependent methyltransferase n=1 Tax=Prochlorococcus marinus TaxID=1219 RepID=UPI0022B34F72|nr:SAM-dependent methyltransferase [Prochlorococcus marinus]